MEPVRIFLRSGNSDSSQGVGTVRFRELHLRSGHACSEIGFPQPIKAKHIVGIFRYQTGDQDPDAKKKGLDKTDYILEELDPAAPGTVRKKHVGSNKEVSATKAGTVVKNLFSQ
jgi:hypothetical protein